MEYFRIWICIFLSTLIPLVFIYRNSACQWLTMYLVHIEACIGAWKACSLWMVSREQRVPMLEDDFWIVILHAAKTNYLMPCVKYTDGWVGCAWMHQREAWIISPRVTAMLGLGGGKCIQSLHDKDDLSAVAMEAPLGLVILVMWSCQLWVVLWLEYFSDMLRMSNSVWWLQRFSLSDNSHPTWPRVLAFFLS
jgi:hypothetical protein